MEIQNLAPETIGFGCFPYRRSRREWVTVVVLRCSWRVDPATGELSPFAPPGENAPSPCCVQGVGDDAAAAPVHPGSLMPFKPLADICFDAVAHAPGGKPVSGLAVSVAVGGWSKELFAVGDRTWRSGWFRSGYSDPEPFVTMPLDLSRALGGPDDAANPWGRGRASKVDDQPGPLPNVEWPGRMVAKPSDRIPPATFGSIGDTHPDKVRASTGNYDRAWLTSHWPGPPPDFDWQWFQTAPADQRVDRGLVGDEELRFVNLHPEHPRLEYRLPGQRVRCFVESATGEGDETSFDEVTLRLDLLWARPHEDVVELTWRGLVPVPGPDPKHWRAVVFGLEPLAEPREPEWYREHGRAVAAEWDAQFEVEDEDAAELSLGPLPPLAADPGPPDADTVRVDEEADEMLREVQAEVAADHAAGRPIPPPADPVDALRELVQTADGSQERAFLDALKIDPAALDNLANEFQADLTELSGLADALGSGADAGADAQAKAAIAAAPIGEQVAQAKADGEPLTGADFDGADLAGVDLRDIDLSGASFDGACLDGADLSGAVLVDARFEGASCVGSKWVGADLNGASFEECALADADFTRAKCNETTFTACGLAGANWDRTFLEGVQFERTELVGQKWHGIHAAGATFEECDLTDADLGEAVLSGANFSGSKLVGADLRGADLVEAEFSGADLSGARLGRARMSMARADEETSLRDADLVLVDAPDLAFGGAVFDGAILRGANLRGSQLAACSFRDCRLDAADLSNASLDDACVVGASLLKTKLVQSGLARADFTSADLRGAVLYDAGLDEVVLEEASLRDADLGNTIVEVRR